MGRQPWTLSPEGGTRRGAGRSRCIPRDTHPHRRHKQGATPCSAPWDRASLSSLCRPPEHLLKYSCHRIIVQLDGDCPSRATSKLVLDVGLEVAYLSCCLNAEGPGAPLAPRGPGYRNPHAGDPDLRHFAAPLLLGGRPRFLFTGALPPYFSRNASADFSSARKSFSDETKPLGYT